MTEACRNKKSCCAGFGSDECDGLVWPCFGSPYCCQPCQRRHQAALWDAEQSAVSAWRVPLAAPSADEPALFGVPVSREPAEANLDAVAHSVGYTDYHPDLPPPGPKIVHPAGAIPTDIEARMAGQAAAVKAARTPTQPAPVLEVASDGPTQMAPPGSLLARAIRRLLG